MSSISIQQVLSETKVQLLIESLQQDLEITYPFLNEWTVEFDKAKRRAGACKVYDKVITLSLWHISNNPIEVYQDTILHEFAHAIAFELYGELGHGKRWKQVARKIGAVPKSTGKFNLPESPWHLVVFNQETAEIEKLAPRYRRTKKIKDYYLKGRPETKGQLYFVCSQELALYESD